MPTLLYINTSKQEVEIAISQNEQLFIWENNSTHSSQAALINLAIEATCKKANITIQDIEGICICAGPGSYTGLRVGMSTAKGLCFALNIPLMLISSLELALISTKYPLSDEVTLTLFEAREGESFIRIAQNEQELLMEHIYNTDLKELEKQYNFVRIFAEHIPQSISDLTSTPLAPTNWQAWKKKTTKMWHHKEFADLAYSEPFYLKGVYITQTKKKPF